MACYQNMKSHGNLLMNKIFNPKNVKPPIPTDIDESDSCMERFIRQKYQYRSLEDGKPKPPSREDESYTRAVEEPRRNRSPDLDFSVSPEGSPPPLPPKSGKFFGFGLRSSSSTSNLRRFGTKSKTTPSPTPDHREWSPPPPQKSTGLGAPVADVTTASFEAKMAALREMGFANDRRNEMVLRGLNENLDKSIETLVRLGEGSHSSSRSRTPALATSNTTSARVVTPKPETSNNPFERAASNPVPQQPQQPQSASYNPFERPTQTPASAQPLESSFQNLQVNQPLFPHSTGGYPAQANLMPQPPYQQSFTPVATSTYSQGGYVSSPQIMENSYNPFFQTASQQQGNVGNQTYPAPGATQNNPFFNNMQQNSYTQPQSHQSGPSVPALNAPRPPQHANTLPAVSSTSPFGTSPFGQSPFQSQPPQQLQPQPQQPQALNTGQGSYNPFQQSMASTTPQGAGGYSNQFPPQQPQPQQPQQLMPQATGRMDKGSILSLYNLAPSPSAIPLIPEQSQFQPGVGTSPVPPLTNSLNSTPQSQPGSNFPTPQPSAGNFVASRNPYNGAAPAGSGLAAQAGITQYAPSSGLGIGMGTNGTTGSAPGMGMKSPFAPTGGFQSSNQPFQRPHISQPSVDINGLQNGRHSPDAFASLSARYG